MGDQALFEHHENITNTTTEMLHDAVTEVYNSTVSPNGNEHMLEEAQELYDTFGPQECEANLATLSDRWAYSIPTMTFSFVCHTAVLPIYAELKQPSAKKMQAVSNTSVSICLILYVTSALFGYLTFFNWMEAEMLLMYSYVNSADIMTLINTLVIFVPSIREVFGIIGATASTMLVFVLPSVFYLKLDPGPYKTPRKLSAIFMVTLGLGLMIQSLTVIIAGYLS